MISSACDCLPTLYSLFRCGWNVNSQETDFYFDETAAQCWSKLFIKIARKESICYACSNLLIESDDSSWNRK